MRSRPPDGGCRRPVAWVSLVSAPGEPPSQIRLISGTLDDNVIGEIVAHLANRPSDLTYACIWALGNAVQRVPADVTAFGDRSAPFVLSLDAIWSDTADDAANIDWVRTGWTDMQRYGTGRMYLNFPGHGEGDHLVREALGPETYGRLARVKRAYDPDNLFRMNQNVQPD